MVTTNNATNKTADTFTATTSLATTFDTNVAAAGVEIAGTTISADGTDANIDITMTPKGTGTVNPSALSVNSAYDFPTADGTAGYVLSTSGAGVVSWASNASTGNVVQVVTGSTSSLVVCSTAMPADDSIPQITEGDEVITATITPTNSSNTLLIDFVSSGSRSSAAEVVVGLFQDATAGGLSAIYGSTQYSTNHTILMSLNHNMAAGTTSSTTFRIRVGPSPAGTFYVNGIANTRRLGGVANTQLRIIEIKA